MPGANRLLFDLFTPGTFSRVFYAVLFPPVIFNAGFTLKHRNFMANIGSIFTYAFLGTIVATVVLSLAIYGINLWLGLVRLDFIESLMFGALLSPIDTVATISVLTEMNVIPLLYSLVFGESVLNDAVAIALCTALAPYVGKTPQWSTLGKISKDFAVIVLGSVGIGVLFGYLAAFVCISFTQQQQHQQKSMVLMTWWLAQTARSKRKEAQPVGDVPVDPDPAAGVPVVGGGRVPRDLWCDRAVCVRHGHEPLLLVLHRRHHAPLPLPARRVCFFFSTTTVVCVFIALCW